MKGATSTIHYVPIIVVTAISGILMLMLSSRLGALITNPEVFLEPAIQSAARDIALVCDGKLSEKKLSPPPPGAYYLIMNCKDRQISKATSDIYLAAQLAGAVKNINDIRKGLTKNGDELLKLGDEMSSALRKEGALTKTVLESGETVLELSDEAADILSVIGRNGGETVDAVTAARKSVDDVAEGATNAEAASASAARKEEQAKSTSEELQKLDELPRENGKVRVNCAENKELCDAIQYGTIRYQSAGEAVKEASRAYKNAANTAEDVFKVKGDAKSSVFSRDLLRRDKSALSEFIDARAALRKTVDVVSVGGQIALNKKVLIRIRKMVVPRIRKYMQHPDFMDINIQFLDDHQEFYEVLTGNFVGIKYTPIVVNIVNFTSDEEKNELLAVYNNSINATSAALEISYAIKKAVASTLGTFGYYETINYFEDLEADRLIAVNQDTNLDAGAYMMAASEFGVKIKGKCTTDACAETAINIVNKSFDVGEGLMNYHDFTNFVRGESDSEIQEEINTLGDVLDYLNQINEMLKPLAGELTKVQLGTADWLKNNCQVNTITYGAGQIDVATCGMVIDCSPGDYCFFGIPVVNSDPWIPYIPVGVIDEQNVDTISNIIGLNYDSSQRIVSPGLNAGCGGTGILSTLYSADTLSTVGLDFDVPEENKVYICAMTSYAQRCRIVACDKYVKTEANNFVPTPTVEDTGDNILIGGNFATW